MRQPIAVIRLPEEMTGNDASSGVSVHGNLSTECQQNVPVMVNLPLFHAVSLDNNY